MARKKATPSPRPALRPKAIGMDEVYRLLNRVQINRKEVTFALTIDDSTVAYNVIKDLGLRYESKPLKTKVVFTVFPNPEEEVEHVELDIDIDLLGDEIAEDGYLF